MGSRMGSRGGGRRRRHRARCRDHTTKPGWRNGIRRRLTATTKVLSGADQEPPRRRRPQHRRAAARGEEGRPGPAPRRDRPRRLPRPALAAPARRRRRPAARTISTTPAARAPTCKPVCSWRAARRSIPLHRLRSSREASHRATRRTPATSWPARHRQWLVEEVVPPSEPKHATRVRMVCLETRAWALGRGDGDVDGDGFAGLMLGGHGEADVFAGGAMPVLSSG